MIVTIVTFHLSKPTTLEEITKTFQSTAPQYQGMPGLLRKNYYMSEDGRRKLKEYGIAPPQAAGSPPPSRSGAGSVRIRISVPQQSYCATRRTEESSA